MGVPSRSQQAVEAFQFANQDIPWLLNHWAEKKPDHPFLIWEPKDADGIKTWTYADFARDVRRLAAGLHQRGITKGDKVMIHTENSPEMVLAWYACATVGAVGVTTNTKSVGNEINYLAGHARCVAAITQPKFAELIRENAPGLKWIVVTADNSGEPAEEDVSGFESFDSLYADESAWSGRPAEPMLPVGIMYTSGTTSRPKAVVHTHANALWASRVGSHNIDLDDDSVYLIYLPFFHVNAQSWTTWSSLGVGSTIVLQPKFSVSRFWDVVVRQKVTHISIIPFVYKALMIPDRPANNLKVGVFGLIVPEVEAAVGFRVIGAYGMTETVTHCIHTEVRGERMPTKSMGKPTPGYQALIVDSETGRICDDGSTGELWIRGVRGQQLFLEYFDNPEANAKAFTEDGWFKTGDMVRIDDTGNFIYSERDKDLLKVGGENVSSREVEDTARTVPGIAEIAVVSQKHDFLGEVAVAFVIKAPNGEADDATFEAAIIDVCKQNLADFKVPRAVYFVDEFPRATLDKVAKNKLREIADAKVTSS
jgi:crotonobetaine/carnitine-CoA ligase